MFTPYIINSLVLLTISSTLLVVQSNSDDPKGVSRGKYALGFVCTTGASAGCGLLLSLDQLCFSRVIGTVTLRAVLNMIVYPSLVASVIIVVGLFGSGEWEHMGREMDGYELGKVSYVMNLVGTAIAWQVFTIGIVGLIFEVSSLFSNSISVVGLPIVCIFAVVFFGERMDGVKVMAMILAIWGFVSFVYQYYLDDTKLKAQGRSVVGDKPFHWNRASVALNMGESLPVPRGDHSLGLLTLFWVQSFVPNMGELAHHRHPQELQLHIVGDQEAKEENSSLSTSIITNNQATRTPKPKNFRRWIKVALYSLFVLSGQAVATLLGRQYYNKGGNSKWLVTLLQLVGFPILFLLYFIPTPKQPSDPNITHMQTDAQAPSQSQSPPLKSLALVYLSLGTIVALNCYLYSTGLLYLPVSTYSLICSSQLAFNAFFSFFLNSQKFTPYIINSLVLLTISSTLLVFQSDSEVPKGVSSGKYALGFVCTIGASAGYGLILSLTQLCFRRVIRKETFRAVLDMLLYQSLVASVIVVVGLFASGEWEHLGREMDGYELGKVSYVMNLVGTAISWQVFGIGAIGLIKDISSLFSNSIGVMGLPIVPILAVVFFGDRMDGIKVMSMILAIWGFISFVYQHKLDVAMLKAQRNSVGGNEVSASSPLNAPIARVGG
ncbi:hypothetical protein NL676_012629 [Syzygium grande]|nr:hypothetical protein NL676_012629 [Syzygium grande]